MDHLFIKRTIRETSMGANYLDLADRFNLSQEKRKELDLLLDEPDGNILYKAEWENRARELFDEWHTDRHLFYSAHMGIAKRNMAIRKQTGLN